MPRGPLRRRGRRVVVVGGGAAGLAAARTALAHGARAVLVSDGPLGGDCTWTGCVPSKSLLERGAAGDDYRTAHAHLHAARARIAATEDAEALARDGVDVVVGTARLHPGPTVVVDGADLGADAVVWASGSRPLVPDVPGLVAGPHLTTDTVFDLTDAPASLLVLGGGAVGCELATAFARFGSHVVLLEAGPRLLAHEEPAASAVVERSLHRLGVDVRTGTALTAVEPATGAHVTAVLERDGASQRLEVEQVLVAVGRRPAGAEALLRLGAQPGGRGEVVVDDRMRTRVEDVWAAGDCTGRLPFTHAADAMGRVAGANAARGWHAGRARHSTRATPWVTFTDPPVARVGLTEAQAAERVRGARVAHLPLEAVDRAVVAGRTDGFVRLVVGPRRALGSLGGGRVLGATVVAPGAGETIAEIALCMHLDAFAGRLAQATHAYPTYGTAVQMAAAQLFGGFAGLRARPARRLPAPGSDPA